MDDAQLVESPRPGRTIALWLGGLVAGVAVVTQAYLALRLISLGTPGLAWRTCVGAVLGLAAPTAGVVAFFRGDLTERSQGRRVARTEFVSGVIGLTLIVPTLVIIIVTIGVSGGIF